MTDQPKVLVPYDRREAMTLAQAAKVANRSVTTVRNWCGTFFIGRRVVGGPWQVSRVALCMLLSGDETALEAYLGGDRTSHNVRTYFEAAGLAPSESAKLTKLAEVAKAATSA